MKSLNFCVLGDEEIARQLGKKGTTSDITIYDRKDAGVIRTFTVPTSFPDKIQPLFQALNIAEHVIFHIAKLDKFTGEQIVAIDALGKRSGLLTHSYDIDPLQLKAMLKNTSLKDFRIVERDSLKKEVETIEPISRDGDVEVVIDHFFDVKGVGTVLLGKVSKGTLKVHDTLKLLTSGQDVLVKSMQMHDDPVSEARCPARVGMAVKGIKPDDVQRGDILASSGSVFSELELEFRKSPFYRDDIMENQTFIVNIGLQMKPCKIVSVSPFRISLTKPAVVSREDRLVLLKPESQTTRIIGSGSIK